MTAHEVNFDGLVGLTHNYAGLSHGNLASDRSAGAVANPQAAALQGLAKMKALHDLGVKQAVLPPHQRPHLPTLRGLGFQGDDPTVWQTAWQQAPEIAVACCSAASMWVANAATVSPAVDATDGLTHFTPANLSSMFHRSIEHQTTARILQSIFDDPARYCHHPALPSGTHFSDEGAANHTRLCADYDQSGVELFVFGRYAFGKPAPTPRTFPARQTFEASRAIAANHQLPLERVVFAQQNPDVVDAGVFHNDVIAVGDRNVLFFHQEAFLDADQVLDELRRKCQFDLHTFEVTSAEVPVDQAVQCYLFNTQLVRSKNGTTVIAPQECQTNPRINDCLERFVADSSPIDSVQYFDLKQSMNNGGGPACLRLRVVMSEQDIENMAARVLMSDELYRQLVDWVQKHYRERLTASDLRDPDLVAECYTALDELTKLLNLGSIYDFQTA